MWECECDVIMSSFFLSFVLSALEEEFSSDGSHSGTRQALTFICILVVQMPRCISQINDEAL